MMSFKGWEAMTDFNGWDTVEHNGSTFIYEGNTNIPPTNKAMHIVLVVGSWLNVNPCYLSDVMTDKFREKIGDDLRIYLTDEQAATLIEYYSTPDGYRQSY